MKTRKVRRRQLRRWDLRQGKVDRRNGVGPDGHDPRGVGYAMPWCVIAFLSNRGSTRVYKRNDFRALTRARCPGYVSRFRYS